MANDLHRRNALLAMLPEAATQRLDHAAALVTVLPGDALQEPGDAVDVAWFPIDAVVAHEQPIADAVETAEAEVAPAVALTGAEGMVGIEPLFRSDQAAGRTSVVIGGQALRVDADVLRQEVTRGGAFQRLWLRWIDAFVAQVAATSSCERVHPVEQRLVRWLLSCDDRAPLRELGLTQATLAQLLGVRRASITAAAGALRRSGLIAYQRGMLTIVDRAGLEQRSCRCYRDISARYRAYLSAD